jgi:hypothetical protein
VPPKNKNKNTENRLGHDSSSSSYIGKYNRRIMVHVLPRQKVRCYLQNNQRIKDCRHGSRVTALASKHEAMSSNCSAPPPKKKL